MRMHHCRDLTRCFVTWTSVFPPQIINFKREDVVKANDVSKQRERVCERSKVGVSLFSLCIYIHVHGTYFCSQRTFQRLCHLAWKYSIHLTRNARQKFYFLNILNLYLENICKICIPRGNPQGSLHGKILNTCT